MDSHIAGSSTNSTRTNWQDLTLYLIFTAEISICYYYSTTVTVFYFILITYFLLYTCMKREAVRTFHCVFQIAARRWALLNKQTKVVFVQNTCHICHIHIAVYLWHSLHYTCEPDFVGKYGNVSSRLIKLRTPTVYAGNFFLSILFGIASSPGLPVFSM